MYARKEVVVIDALNLSNEALAVIKRDLLAFVHSVSTMGATKSAAEVSVLPAVAELLINNTV